MKKFNKVLSMMESVYGISNKPIVESVDPIYVSDFIHTVFENKEQYGLANTDLSAEWFSSFSEKNKDKACSMIQTILQETGHIVSKKSIMEGIDKYNEGFEDV